MLFLANTTVKQTERSVGKKTQSAREARSYRDGWLELCKDTNDLINWVARRWAI
jgi:hypothetical protein